MPNRPGAAANESPGAPRPLVVGHRGARARFPENSLPAVRHALESGADGVEVDARLTADGVLAVIHDATLPDRFRDAGGEAPAAGLSVRDLSFESLRRFDCGAVADTRFPAQRAVPGARVPSLHEVFDLLDALAPCAASRALLFLELKREEGPPSRTTHARLAVDLLRQRGALARTFVLSFDHALLRAARDLEPTLATVPLVNRETDLPALARSEAASWIGPRHALLDAPAVEALHAEGVRVFAWTANEPGEQDRLASLGVDAIGTDDPEALLGRLASRTRPWGDGGSFRPSTIRARTSDTERDAPTARGRRSPPSPRTRG